MDINTKTFGTLKQETFNGAMQYLKRIAKRATDEFENLVTYAVAAVFQTGDFAHINKALAVLVACGMEPLFRRTVVAHGLIPFKYNKDECQYEGKIFKGRRAALEMLNTDNIPQWEVVLRAALDGESPENKEPPAFKLETRMPNLIKKAFENGYNVQDVRKIVNAAIKEHCPATPVQEVAENIRKEEAEQREAA